MKKAISAALLGGALASGGCIGGMMDGDSGPIMTKTVSRSDFTKIDLRGSADLVVQIGSEASINIEGNKSRVENVKTSVEDGVLVIEEKNEGLFGHNSGKLTITITAPSISAVKLSGSGDIDISGAKGDSFKVEINGSGDVDVTGEVDSADFTIRGSGDIAATELVASEVSVSISGSGDADVFAADSIDASIRGSGDITYFGGAKDVKRSVKGSGDISAAK